jgi:hypothetical protein
MIMSYSYQQTARTFLLAAGLLLAGGASAATLNVPGEYATIQAAINAANADDTILVAAGTYQESLGGWRDIELFKSVSLIGAGSGQTIVEFSGLQHGLEIHPDATGTVLVQGLTFTKQESNAMSAAWAVLVGETGGTFQSITFRDVEIAWASARNLHFADAVYHDIVIEDCNIHHADAWGCSVRGTIHALTVANSNFDYNGWTPAAAGIGLDIDMPAFVEGVTVTGGSFSHNTSKGINLVKTTDAVFDGVVASYNGGHAAGGFGVSLWEWNSASSGLTFRNSSFVGNTTDGFLFGTEGTTTISDVTIEHCYSNGNGRHGVLFYHDFGGTVSNIAVTGCDLTGNTGRGLATSAVSATIDASGNWWGSNTEAGVLAALGADVDYTPWLDHGTDLSGDPGFQGDVSTLWVSALSPQTGASGRIQEAVDLVTGSTVYVLAGTYEEQVVIMSDDLQLIGSGAGDDPATNTVIRSPVSLPYSYATGTNNNYPVVGVIGCQGVSLENLRVDGYGRGNSNYRFQGVGFWNAGGVLENCQVVNIQDTPFSGAQHGVGVYAYNNTGGPYAIAMTDVVVADFQKNGLALLGEGLTVDLVNVTAIGKGATSVTAQNGIQIGDGAGGTVATSAISDVAYTGASWTATGFLLQEAADVAADAVVIDNCQTSVYWIDTSGSFADGSITDPLGDAFYAYSSGAKTAALPRRIAQPLDEAAAKGGAKAPVSLTVDGCLFRGAGATDSWGFAGYGYGPLDLAMTNCEVTAWDLGVVLYDAGGATFTALAEYNAIHGNTSYGLYSNALETAQASCNWWGDSGGPDTPGNPNPAGDVIEGPAVYWPWLDAIDGECVMVGDNNVSVGDAEICLTPETACVDLPVTFNRLDTTPSRGVSVMLQLSPELVLCGSPAASIIIATGAGSWSEGFTNLHHEIIDNGGGSYTVDRAVLGLPCGPTQGGLLFTVRVAAADGVTDANGTVTVTDVLVRDCENATLAGIPGAPGHVTIDLVSPAVLTGLAASQDKTDNPAGGTTNIDLTWTAPGGDAYEIEIWRKGFGFYPEYDDAGGAVPAAPVTAANGWTLAAVVPAAAASYADYTTARDFWYFAAYVVDGCGNRSAASALTGGTLNYHLGDVSDGATAGAGDNLVDSLDISLLGAHYGITLTLDHPQNYLDVGPTTNYSVDARPLTDNRVQFEDLMMFAINFGQVSKAESAPPAPAAANTIVLQPGSCGEVGSLFEVEVRFTGDGQIQGLSIPLTWDSAVVEPMSVRAGDLLAAQGGLGLVLAPEPGTVDAALFGVRERGISGDGVLAVVSFRVQAPGEPALGLGAISARDAANQAVPIDGSLAGGVPAILPQASQLARAVPNPFNPATELSFAIARDGLVRLNIYSLRGQLVKSLVNSSLAAGSYRLTWDGTDGNGQTAASGSYIVRLEAPDCVQTQRITLVK